MAKCIRCKLEIKDDTMMCPLCNGVLVRDEEEFATAKKKIEDYLKKNYLRRVQAPIGVKPRLVTWMQLN